MRRRSLFSAVLALLPGAQVAAALAVEDFAPYLPAAATFDADYVVVDYDPAIEESGLKLQAAMQADPAWFRRYQDQHAGQEPLPWHPRYGVTEAQYLRLQDPLKHFVELSRQRIRVTQVRDGLVVRLSLAGRQLMFDRVAFDAAVPRAITARDTLEFTRYVPLVKATMPPAGMHEGHAFGSSNETIRASKFRERISIGRYIDGTTRGLLHYSISVPGKTSYAYVTYALK